MIVSTNSQKENENYTLIRPWLLYSVNDPGQTHAGENKSLPVLLKKLEQEKHPRNFKDQLLGITQLFFDSIVESEKGNWEEQEKVFSALVEAGKLTVGSYYQEEPFNPSNFDEEPAPPGEINFDKVKELIFPSANMLMSQYFLGDRESKERWVTHYSSYTDFGRELNVALGNYFEHMKKWRSIPQEMENQYKMVKDLPKIETIATIASGGFEAAYLAMNILGVDNLMPFRYSHESRDDSEVRFPKLAPEDDGAAIEGKSVLLIDDIIGSGKTIREGTKYVMGKNPKELFVSTVLDGRRMPREDLQLENLSIKGPSVWRQVRK